MKITILGSGTSIPHPDRASPGLLIELPGNTVLVDPGSGSLHRIERFGARVADVDLVLFSHYHPDHTGDLGPLLFALANREYFEARPLTLMGPQGLEKLRGRLASLYGRWIALEPGRLTWSEIAEDQLPFGSWTLGSAPVLHGEGSLGYRISEAGGGVFAYSGDTDQCPGLEGLVKDADVALIEASRPSSLKVEGHLTPRLAGEIARRGRVGALVLTHLYPVCDGYDLLQEVRDAGFQGRAALAHDGMVIRI